MDNFTKLELQIENVIKRVMTQIETKEMRVKEYGEKISLKEGELEALQEKIQDLDFKRSVLVEVMDEPVLIVILRKALEQALEKAKKQGKTQEQIQEDKQDETQEEKPKNRWSRFITVKSLAAVGTIGAIGLSALTIFQPLLGVATLAALGACGIAGGLSIKDDYILASNIKKEYTPATLERESNSTKKEIEVQNKELGRLRNKKRAYEISTSQSRQEKHYYEVELQKVRTARSKSMAKVTPFLNNEFNQFDIRDVASRMRARIKKEQTSSSQS